MVVDSCTDSFPTGVPPSPLFFMAIVILDFSPNAQAVQNVRVFKTAKQHH